ncbi:MAG: hypothetical protein ACOY16_05005 [Chloroflexota bacterium]
MSKKQPTKSETRKLRIQQIIFGVIAVMIIVVMILGLVANY